MVIIASNENITTTNHTSALDRRRLTVIIDRKVTEADQLLWENQGGEKEVLHREMSGLVNWLLELSQAEISDIIKHPSQRTLTANLDAMKAANPLAEWAIENIYHDTDSWTQIGDKREIKKQGEETNFEHSEVRLYPNYLLWCNRHGRTAHSVKRFKEILKDTLRTLKVDVIENRQGSGNGYKGIRLKKDWETSNIGVQK